MSVNLILGSLCGHGLVVEHVLAKDETRVRFSLAAHKKIVFLGITMLVMFIKDIVRFCLLEPFLFKICCYIRLN